MLIKLQRQSYMKESFIPYDDRAVIALLEVEGKPTHFAHAYIINDFCKRF